MGATFNVKSPEFHFVSRFTCHWQDEEGLFERVAGALVAWWSETGSEGGRPLQDGGGGQSDHLQSTLPPFPSLLVFVKSPPRFKLDMSTRNPSLPVTLCTPWLKMEFKERSDRAPTIQFGLGASCFLYNN